MASLIGMHKVIYKMQDMLDVPEADGSSKLNTVKVLFYVHYSVRLISVMTLIDE